MTEPEEETTKGVYRYEFSLSIGRCVGSQSTTFCISDIGLSEDWWDRLSEETRQEVLDESLQDWKVGLVDCGWTAKQ